MAILRRTMAVGIGVGDQRRIQSRSDLIRSDREIKLGYVAKYVRHDVGLKQELAIASSFLFFLLRILREIFLCRNVDSYG